jgi:hypothetical protein
MKEEWLMSGAVVPVDVETTAALVAEIRRLIDVVGGMALAQPDAFEQGRQQGMKQERALWTLTKLGQEIEAQPAQKDAARYQHIKGMARAMSLDMGGNHYWHMGLRDIRGANLDEAIDRAIEAELKEKNT